jgi:hypothetical protein
MSAGARSRLAFVAGLLVVAALPVLGRWLRSSGERCAWDGVRIDARTRARLTTPSGEESFCCVSCLVRRLARSPVPGAATRVTDETSAAEVDASDAWFVRSAVVTVPANGSRVHAFAAEADARRHASAFRGTVLPHPGLPSPVHLDEGPP